MKDFVMIVLLPLMFSPVLAGAQEIQRVPRTLEEQQATAYISQAEYYARMALRSLEA
jgi:hypothetical protein